MLIRALTAILLLSAPGALAADPPTTLAGKLVPEHAARFIVGALGDTEDRRALGWALEPSPEELAGMRDQLTSGEHIDPVGLGKALALAVQLRTSNFQRPMILGIAAAPNLKPGDRDVVVAHMLEGLAHQSYEGKRWELVSNTLRPLLIDYLDGGTLEQQRAAATFAVWRVEKLGKMDKLALATAKLSEQRMGASIVLKGEAHALWRRNPDQAAAIMTHLKLEPYRFQLDGPWDITERARRVAEAYCSDLERDPTPISAPPESAPDAKALQDQKLEEQRRQIVRVASHKIIELVENHKGRMSPKLSYRKCEAWMRIHQIEPAESKAQARAWANALDCLRGHLKGFPAHDAARLELAQALDDDGDYDEVISHLVKLVGAGDERSRILGSYRLLGHLTPEDGANGSWKGVPRKTAFLAARLVRERGFDPHQRIYGAMVEAWLDATSGNGKRAFKQLLALLDEVKNKDDDTYAFAHMGGLIDYTNSVAVLAGVPAEILIKRYDSYPAGVRQSSLLQLAHLHSLHGRSEDVAAIGAALRKGDLPPEVELVLVDARLREYGPESKDAKNGTLRTFDAKSALAAIGEFDRLETLRTGENKLMAKAATCIILGNAEPVADTLLRSKLNGPAKKVLERALKVALDSKQTNFMLRLADVEERLGNDKAAVQLYRRVLQKDPALAKQRPLVVLDYYQVVYRLKDTGEDHKLASKMLQLSAKPIAVAIFKSYKKGDERVELLKSLVAALMAEKHYEELRDVSAALKTAGHAELGRVACFDAHQGMMWRNIAMAGLEEHFKAGGGALDGPARCEQAVSSREPGTVAGAVKHARGAASCAPDASATAALGLLEAELHRLTGQLDKAGAALDAVGKTGERREEWEDVNERLAYTALLSGDLKRASHHMERVGTPRARLFAGHISYSEADYVEAQRIFGDLAKVAGGDPEPAIWAARAMLMQGDARGWSKALTALTKKKKKRRKRGKTAEAEPKPAPQLDAAQLRKLVVAEIQRDGERAPKEARKLLKKLSRRDPTAKGLLALDKARAFLSKKMEKLSRTRTDRAKTASRNGGKLARMVPRLIKLLKPALSGSKKGGPPSAAVIVPALDIVVGGLDAVHGYIAAHEDVLSKLKRGGDAVATNLMGLEDLAINLGQNALGAAKKQAYSGPALRRLVSRLARRFPETFGEGTAVAVSCDDELTVSKLDLAVEGVPGALSRLAAKGHGELASVLSQTCSPANSTTYEWAALRFLVAWNPKSKAPSPVRSRVAGDLAIMVAEDPGKLDASVRETLAAHFGGVDCERALRLSEGLDGTAALKRVRAGCQADMAALLTVLESNTSARGLRRLAEILQKSATTEADGERLTKTIEAAATAAGLPPAEVMFAPICSLPR